MNTFELSLDLDKSYAGEPVRLRQGDKRGTEIRAAIYDHGEPLTGSYTARYVQAIAGTGNEYYRVDATFAAGVATVTVNEEYAAAVAGNTYGYFQFVSGSTVIASTQSFPVLILPDATAEAEVGEQYDSAIEDALAELDEATGRISQMVIDATAEYLEAHPEITTTVQDNSITDAKLVQQGGILDRVARLWYRLDNLLTATPAEADALTVSDAAATPMAGLALYGRSTQDGTPTPDAPVAIESVTPNLLDVSTLLAHGIGTTYAIGADGRVTVNASDNMGWASQATIDLPAGTYTIMREVNRGRVQLPLYDVGSTTPRQTISLEANGAFSQTFTVTVPTQARLKVGVSSDASNYPFTTGVALYAGSVAYPFVPHGCAGLWARGRNLAKTLTSGTRTNSGITWTNNADGSVTASGTATSNSWSYATADMPNINLPAGTYTTFVCLADGTVPSGYCPRIVNASDSTTIKYAQGVTEFTLTEETNVLICFVAIAGTVASDTTLHMVIEAGSTATPYQPYVESVTPIDLGGRSLRSLPDGTRDEVNVDEYGHAILTQRVGEFSFGFSPLTQIDATSIGSTYRIRYNRSGITSGSSNVNGFAESLPPLLSFASDTEHWYIANDVLYAFVAASSAQEAADKVLNTKIYLPLATPVTIDLGTVEPIALQGPDMTAQAVPTAPFQLTYERDLNVTLARLEAAIADAATA